MSRLQSGGQNECDYTCCGIRHSSASTYRSYGQAAPEDWFKNHAGYHPGEGVTTKNVDRILIVVNAQFYSQFESWRKQFSEGRTSGPTIELLNDNTYSNETRLGAVGDICLGLENVGCDGDVLIIAGDNLFEGDLQAFVDLRNRRNASVLGIHRYPSLEDVRKKFGVVTMDSEGCLQEFEKKPEFPRSSLAATAIYLIRKQALRHVIVLNRAPHSGELNAGMLIRELI